MRTSHAAGSAQTCIRPYNLASQKGAARVLKTLIVHCFKVKEKACSRAAHKVAKVQRANLAN